MVYLRADFMHHVTKLMEVSLHLVVLQQRGPTLPGFGEVRHHSSHRKPAFPIRPSAAGLQAEAGGVAELSLPGGR